MSIDLNDCNTQFLLAEFGKIMEEFYFRQIIYKAMINYEV